MPPLPSAPIVLPIWQGRRGWINAIACALLGTLCALGLMLAVERTVVAPVCGKHAAARGMTYQEFTLVGRKQLNTVVCILRRPDGRTEDVYLKSLLPFFADMLVGLAMGLELTVPSFILLLAIARSAPYLRRMRSTT